MNKLSVIVPLYNEEQTIQQVISQVKGSDTLKLQKEIIVVNDGSTDASPRILSKISGIKVITHSKNLGKAAAIKSGFLAASGDIILIQDADLEYSPENYPTLLKPITSGKADVVYGSRLLTSQPHRVLFFWHFLANQFLTYFSNVFSNLNLSDMETGYKVFTKQIVNMILPHLNASRFGFEPEVTALVGKLATQNSCRVYEVGISYYGRTYAEGKKITTIDALHATWCILRYNLAHLEFNSDPAKIT